MSEFTRRLAPEGMRIAPEGAQRTKESLIKELIEICDELEYDAGNLPFKVMREEISGPSLFKNYERLSTFLRAYRDRLLPS